MYLIEAKDIRKKYQNREVVKGIHVYIKQGEILALIGTNGAGKSTTLAMLLGVIHPDSGKIKRWRKDYQAHTGVQLQSTPFFEGYTTAENLQLFAALYHIRLDKKELYRKLAECNLQDFAKTPASKLSGGQQKRLAIAVTTIHDPDLIVLDEPAAGLDPCARHEIKHMIQQLAQNNVTVLFSSHDMEEVLQIADRIILMHDGQIVIQGNPKILLQQYQEKDLDSLYLTLINNL